MDNVLTGGMQNVLHAVSQVLLVPVMVVLVALIVYALYMVGALIAEQRTERRHLNARIPELMDSIDGGALATLSDTVEHSGLLKRQRAAMQVVLAHAQLPVDDLLALARKLVYSEEEHYGKVVGRSDFVAKVGPMFGLMGTLIPLGPGIVAMGQGDTQTLSDALLIAFDTTTAGLVAAVIALVVSKFRLRWYADYVVMLETVMTAILKKLRDDGAHDAEGLRALAAAASTRVPVGKASGAGAVPLSASATAPAAYGAEALVGTQAARGGGAR